MKTMSNGFTITHKFRNRSCPTCRSTGAADPFSISRSQYTQHPEYGVYFNTWMEFYKCPDDHQYEIERTDLLPSRCIGLLQNAPWVDVNSIRWLEGICVKIQFNSPTAIYYMDSVVGDIPVVKITERQLEIFNQESLGEILFPACAHALGRAYTTSILGWAEKNSKVSYSQSLTENSAT